MPKPKYGADEKAYLEYYKDPQKAIEKRYKHMMKARDVAANSLILKPSREGIFDKNIIESKGTIDLKSVSPGTFSLQKYTYKREGTEPDAIYWKINEKGESEKIDQQEFNQQYFIYVNKDSDSIWYDSDHMPCYWVDYMLLVSFCKDAKEIFEFSKRKGNSKLAQEAYASWDSAGKLFNDFMASKKQVLMNKMEKPGRYASEAEKASYERGYKLGNGISASDPEQSAPYDDENITNRARIANYLKGRVGIPIEMIKSAL